MGLGIESLNDQIDVALKNINTVITGKDPIDMDAKEINSLKEYLGNQLIILNNHLLKYFQRYKHHSDLSENFVLFLY